MKLGATDDRVSLFQVRKINQIIAVYMGNYLEQR